mmetsp:Transcript_3874/g.10629  ORF Transcript_3874/g.10629 Transcript_3874/m.10629 type:complete len:90 (+) Transcript_3874:1369-1638(+)
MRENLSRRMTGLHFALPLSASHARRNETGRGTHPRAAQGHMVQKILLSKGSGDCPAFFRTIEKTPESSLSLCGALSRVYENISLVLWLI